MPKLTPADRTWILNLRAQGLSTRAIATETGQALRTVTRITSKGTGPIPVAQPARNAAIVAAAERGESKASIGRRWNISGKRVAQILLAAEKRKALALATAAEANLTVAKPRPAVAKVVTSPVKKPAKRKDRNAARRRARNRAIVAMAKAAEISRNELAQRFGVSPATVWNVLKRAGVRPFNPNEIRVAGLVAARAERDKLLAADAATMTLAQLGRKYGLKPSSVKAYLHPLGVKARTRAELAAQAPVEIPAFLPPRERTHGTDAIGRKTVTTPAGNVVVLDEVEPATKAPAAPVDLFKAYDLLKSAMPKPAPAADLHDDYLPEPKTPAPVPPGAFLAEIEARHGTAEVLRRHPDCDEGDLLAALREGRKSVKAPVDDLPQPWLTRAGVGSARFFGFGRS